MQKMPTHFEQVPVEVAEKVLEQENLSAHRDGNDKPVTENSADTPSKPKMLSRKPEVSVA